MEGGGREVHEVGDICIPLIHVDTWQKPTQHCKAIILSLKIDKNFKSMVDFNTSVSYLAKVRLITMHKI